MLNVQNVWVQTITQTEGYGENDRSSPHNNPMSVKGNPLWYGDDGMNGKGVTNLDYL